MSDEEEQFKLGKDDDGGDHSSVGPSSLLPIEQKDDATGREKTPSSLLSSSLLVTVVPGLDWLGKLPLFSFALSCCWQCFFIGQERQSSGKQKKAREQHEKCGY